MNTSEKIKAGKIRIERVELKGLGMTENEAIDLEKLDDIITFCGKSGCIDVLIKTIAAVADIHSGNHELKDGEIKEYVTESVINALPDFREVFILRKLIDVFNT